MPIEPFRMVSGRAVPFLRDNVDTDVVIRIERLAELARDELGLFAFEALRYLPDGTPDPDCAFNQAAYQGAPILIAGENFGCGSSREGAVWAIQGLGIRTVIAPSFGPIFRNNCFENGVLPVELPKRDVETLAEIAKADPSAPITVDLDRCVVVPPNGTPVAFAIDRLKRDALLAGLDSLGLTLKRGAEIEAFQRADREARPWIYRGLAGQ
ncbi:MAG: 3-isopropylmalate dehydratase small subunit [Hyphomicrobiaceae bacterium]